jgi:octaprenyl-diphosphate synthase
LSQVSAALKDIYEPIQGEIDRVEEVLRQELAHDNPFVGRLLDHAARFQGKRVRPALLLHCAHVLGGVTDLHIALGAAVEMIHNATLIHDDVVDGSDMRRGMPSLHSVWSDKASILMGDYLLSKAFSLLVDIGSQETMNILAKATVRLSSGEIHQIQQSTTMETAEKLYFKVISDKTASLFSAGCEMGPVFSNGGGGMRKAMASFGEWVGMAFQITDDILDFEGTEEETGKPPGIDLREKHLTLPLIHALNTAPAEEAGRMKDILKNELSAEQWHKVRLFITQYGGIDYSARRADEFAGQARTELACLHDSPAKESLVKVVSHSISRRR